MSDPTNKITLHRLVKLHNAGGVMNAPLFAPTDANWAEYTAQFDMADPEMVKLTNAWREFLTAKFNMIDAFQNASIAAGLPVVPF